jgi:hypothetical protein
VPAEALRRLADEMATPDWAGWRERLAALEAEGRARAAAAAAACSDEVRRAVEAAGEVPPAH